MPSFACTQCGTKLQAGDDAAGRPCQCPSCKARLVVPAPAADLTVAVPSSRAESSDLVGDGTLSNTASSSGEASVQDARASGPAATGRYVAEQEIARGGMGVVLRAHDNALRREVALKYMLDDRDSLRRARFIEEAQVTGQLEHPNIVPVHELGTDADGRPFFSMKLVHGRSLAQVLNELRAGAPLAVHGWPLPRLLGVLVNVCHALSYAHSRGVIHRDLKPANIFLGDFGEVYVMDWGLAKLRRRSTGLLPAPTAPAGTAPQAGPVPASDVAPVDSDRGPSDGAFTVEGTILGTPAYMPPEQARGRVQEIDERCDVYSLGAILYELLALQPPIERGDRIQMLLRIVENEIVPPERRAPERARRGLIPSELSAVALKALAKAPNDRYPTIEALRRDLEAYLDGRAVSAREDTTVQALTKFVKRNRAASLAAAAVALTVLVILTAVVHAWWVARAAALEAEQANSATLAAQREKDDRTRRAVPALLEAAQLAIERRRFDAALAQVKVALDYDPQSARARLLKGQLLIVARDYAGARTELDRYLKQVPADARTRRLRTLIADFRPDAPEALLVLAMEFSHHQLALAEGVLRAHGKDAVEVRQILFEPTRNRIEAAWKGLGKQLTIDPTGIFALNLASCPQVTNLAPLEGMALTALNLHGCAAITDLGPLRGMPLNRLTLTHCIKVRDLSPLKDMPLTSLSLANCIGVTDLGPLKGMPLTSLDASSCPGVRDLTPLQGLPLTYLNLYNDKVEDLEPLRGMKLTNLQLHGNSSIANIDPLRGMPLTALNLQELKRISSLEPLRGMKLTTLSLDGCTLVHDLAPLTGMPLLSLTVHGTGVTSLTPLKGLTSLTTLDLGATAVSDLTPLRGRPLTSLSLNTCTRITDLAPLQGMRLTRLDLHRTSVSNLSPLRDMPLTWLSLGGCQRVTDLTPLKDIRLNALYLDSSTVSDLTPLRGMPLTILGLQDCSQVHDLSPLEGMRLTTLSLQGSQVKDLTPLRDMPLTMLTLTRCTRLHDLGPLKGMRLRELYLNSNPGIRDLSPLRGMPLEVLYVDSCPNLIDLSPLAGLELHKFIFTPKTATKGVDALRRMKTLTEIGDNNAVRHAPAVFWKKYDAGEYNK